MGISGMWKCVQAVVACGMLWLGSGVGVLGQSACDGERYRYTSAFSDVTVVYDLPYGENVNVFGANETLVFDLYAPAGDAATDRPLLVLAHGGFFLGGANDGEDVVPLAQDFARMGYVVASISYRLGVVNFLDLPGELTRAVWRGVHDSRAAVRHFRRTVAEEGNPHGIDPERIFLGGVSAGGFIALHHAYVDQTSEIPAAIDSQQPGMGGGLEGESGSPGYSSAVAGVFNICGAIREAAWLAPGDVPLVSVHGTADMTVPYGTGTVSLMGFPVIEVDGSEVVHATAEALGLDHCLVPIEGADHVPHVAGGPAYDLTLAAVAGKLSSWACPDYSAQCGAYDFTSGVGSYAVAGASGEADPAEVRLFPNPSHGSGGIRVVVPEEWGSAAGWTLEVRDLGGRLLYADRAAGATWEVSVSPPPGVYLVSIPAWGQTLRWVVQG